MLGAVFRDEDNVDGVDEVEEGKDDDDDDDDDDDNDKDDEESDEDDDGEADESNDEDDEKLDEDDKDVEDDEGVLVSEDDDVCKCRPVGRDEVECLERYFLDQRGSRVSTIAAFCDIIFVICCSRSR